MISWVNTSDSAGRGGITPSEGASRPRIGHNGEVTDTPMTPARTWGGIASVWLVAVVGALLVVLLPPDSSRLSWLWLALAACMLVAFAVQLSTHRKVGFIDRLGASIAGALVIIGGTAVSLSIAAVSGG